MNEEPPSTEAESQKTSIQEKLEKKLKEIYQRFSYKPKNKSEIAEQYSKPTSASQSSHDTIPLSSSIVILYFKLHHPLYRLKSINISRIFVLSNSNTSWKS